MAKAGASTASRAASKREILLFAEKAGAVAARIIAPDTVVTAHWVRWKCQFGCGGFGSSLVCPPHAPGPEETRKMLDEYRRAVLFESASGQTRKIAVALEREIFLLGYYKALGLGAGPCELCGECAFEEGCRHPEESRPSMEACGIDVYATVRRHGYPIDVVRGSEDPQHYYGLVLID